MSTGKNEKLGNGGIHVIFIGYAKNHAGNGYCMYNSTTEYVTETRDITWLHYMYYGKREARDEVAVYPY